MRLNDSESRRAFLNEMDRNVPRLVKAVKLILYDNGMVHRGTTEAIELDDALGRIICAFDCDALPVMAATDRELQALSDEQLENVCTGGDEYHALVSAQANRVLDLAFEGEPSSTTPEGER